VRGVLRALEERDTGFGRLALCLRELVLRCEQRALGIEHVEEVCNAALV
jgi:hypothetical protein